MRTRWTLAFLVVLLAVSLAHGQAVTEREMPSSVEMGHTINISIAISATEKLSVFDVVEFIPLGWEVTDWHVVNYNKNSVVLEYLPSYTYQNKARTAYHWSFRDGLGTSQVLLVYTITAKETGSNEFITVYTYPKGFETSTSIMSVLPSEGVIFCGNQICELGEFYWNCPQDCPQLAVEITDITPIIFVIVVSLIIALFVYMYVRHLRKIMKTRAAIEDIRAYLKLGLKRGYRLREMVNALKGEGVETKLIEELAKEKELIHLETGRKRTSPEQGIIQKIKEVVNELSEEEKISIYDELKIKRL